MGFGLGMAILLDAINIRCVMVPASMKFLGKCNWYLPNWLERVPMCGSNRLRRPPRRQPTTRFYSRSESV